MIRALTNKARPALAGAIAAAGLLACPVAGVAAPIVAPAEFGVGSLAPVLIAHGVGAQIYECKADKGGAPVWTFREPIATLTRDGKTIGRHYAGPSWSLDDGGTIHGKMLASLPGGAPGDIPLLKLGVAARSGAGVLKDVKLVLRLNTQGGSVSGPCASLGDLRAEPYAADYIFLP